MIGGAGGFSLRASESNRPPTSKNPQVIRASSVLNLAQRAGTPLRRPSIGRSRRLDAQRPEVCVAGHPTRIDGQAD